MGSRKGAGRLREEWQHHQQLSTQEARVMDGKLVEQAGGKGKRVVLSTGHRASRCTPKEWLQPGERGVVNKAGVLQEEGGRGAKRNSTLVELRYVERMNRQRNTGGLE